MKIGILFSGQGSQYPGMGVDLYDNYEAAKKIFDLAGNEIKNHCFNSTKEILKLTHITQPAVFTVSMAAYESLIEQLKKKAPEAQISAMAGFSMGEYTALNASGTIDDFNITLDLLKKRGLFMTEAGLDENGKPKGAMAAAFGQREKIKEAVDALREDGILECVNFNSLGQTAVAGDVISIKRFDDLAQSLFKIKVKTLSVSSAFHSSMMATASLKLKDELEKINFFEPSCRIYSNITGKDINEGKPKDLSFSAWMRNQLTLQIKSPVYWQETVENMRDDGIGIFIEVGPGRTLSALASKTVKNAKVFHVEDSTSMEKTVSGIKEVTNEC